MIQVVDTATVTTTDGAAVGDANVTMDTAVTTAKFE